jgi:hypothetical protein
MLLHELVTDGDDLRARLRRREARLEAADGKHPARTPRGQEMAAGHERRKAGHGEPSIRRHDGGAAKLLRGDTDDGKGVPVDLQLAPHDAWVSREAPLPRGVAQDHHVARIPDAVFFRQEEAPQRRLNLKNGEEVSADQGAVEALGRSR